MAAVLAFAGGAAVFAPIPARVATAGDAEDLAALLDRFDKGDADAAAALVKLGAAAAPGLVVRLVGADAKVAASASDALAAIGAPALGPLRDAFGPSTETAKTTIRATLARAAETAHVGGAFRGDRVKRSSLAALGGSIQTDKAVANALDWLSRHQSADGRWGCGTFSETCKGAACGGNGAPQFDPGVTGLALLCFLGAGESSQSGPHKDTVSRGLRYLSGVMDTDGCIGPRTDEHFLYNHGVATMALCEEAMLSQDPDAVARARKAIEFVLAAKYDKGVWRYSVPPDGDGDTSITGWMSYDLALASAAGIAEVPDRAALDAAEWIKRMTEPEFGRTGYQMRGGPSSRFEDLAKKFPNSGSEGLTAIAVMVRLFAQHTPKGDAQIAKGWNLIQKKPPKWDVAGGSIDFYGWFWEAMAMRQIGQPRSWNSSLKEALVGQQKSGSGCAAGSWDPIDAWSRAGGRVYSTAMCCLCLESYYRMDQLPNAK